MPGGPRGRNPLVNSKGGGGLLSALQLPLFAVRPPRGYGILVTVGRTSGKRRRRCVRAPRSGDVAVLVAIKGEGTGWLRNLDAEPAVRLRVRGGTFDGRARRVQDDERPEARRTYGSERSFFEYLEHTMWRPGRPTRASIDELHGQWFDDGVPVLVELTRPRRP